MCSGGCGALRGTGPRATGIGVRFFRRAGAVTPIPTRYRFSCIAYLAPAIAHPVHPDNPGHPASDARAIKVLTDLFSGLRVRSIDIKVFQTFAPYKKNARAAQQPHGTGTP